MATTATSGLLAPGGGFLLASPRAEDVFSPAELTDDQRLIGQAAEEFVAKEVTPLIPELELHKEGLMAGLLKKAGEIGLLGGGVPEEYGGSGLDRVSSTVLSEKISTYASFSVSAGAHSGIGTLPIVYFGTEEQKKKYLPKLATGEWIASYCLSEPQAGSDAQNSRTRAVLSPDGRDWILNGQKMWITNGGFADVYIVFAKVDGEKFSCFIVERGFSGFTPGAEEKKMGLRGSSTTPIFFENCRVPRENLLHEIGRGHIVAFNILNVGRFTLGASCLGFSKKELESSAHYAKERTAFGHSISDFGLIRAKLAEMAIRTFALESIIYRTAGLIDQAMRSIGADASKAAHTMKVLEEYAIECSIAKVFGSEVLDYVVDEAVQIYGGYGFHEDYPVARGYRDSRVNRIFEGTNEINRMLIIQMLMKRALAGSLPLMAAGAKLQEEILERFARRRFLRRPVGRREPHRRGRQEGFLARRRRRYAEVSRTPCRSAGDYRRARRYRARNLRHGVRAAPRRESHRLARRFHRSHCRRRPRPIARWRGARGSVRADRAGRFRGRRYAAHADGRVAPHDQARTCGHHRPAPRRGRCRGERRPLSLRRTLNPTNRSATHRCSESFVSGQKLLELPLSD